MERKALFFQGRSRVSMPVEGSDERQAISPGQNHATILKKRGGLG
jgi:hypothetical protein